MSCRLSVKRLTNLFVYSETYDPTFSEAPTKLRQLYQVCDISDSIIVEMLEKEKSIVGKSDEIACDVRTILL